MTDKDSPEEVQRWYFFSNSTSCILKSLIFQWKLWMLSLDYREAQRFKQSVKDKAAWGLWHFPMFTLENEDFCFKPQHYCYFKTTVSLTVDQLLLNLQSKSILGLWIIIKIIKNKRHFLFLNKIYILFNISFPSEKKKKTNTIT